MHANPRYFKILLLTLCILSGNLIFAQSTAKELKTLILKNLNHIGITKDDAEDCVINSNHIDAGSGIEYAYIQQTYKNIKVFNVIISLSFKNGNLLYASGKFLHSSTAFTYGEIPKIQAGNAVSNAARHLNLRPISNIVTRKNSFKTDKKITFVAENIAKKDVETELVWVRDDSGQVRLAWNVSIDLVNSNDWWNVRVDALTGEIVNKDNWTTHEKFLETDENHAEKQHYNLSAKRNISEINYLPLRTNAAGTGSRVFSPPSIQNAAYLVLPYPLESKNSGAVAYDNNPWLKAGTSNNATTHGWHFDGNTNYSITRGNNVYAYDDSSNTNSPGRFVTSTTPPPFVNFNVSPDFASQPFDSTNRNFGIVNMFYWNNIIHDLTYQYGFTELAGNFQADNFGRGGAGNDYVKAEAQDGAGTDNAVFSTPSDGSNGRMQMYLFTAPPIVIITAPSAVANRYTATESQFSSNNKLLRIGAISGQVVLYDDSADPGTTHEGCNILQLPARSVNGKIAMIYRGNCAFITKMRSAQNAGAIAVIVVNNVPGPPAGMGGSDNGITIPGIMISQSDGAAIVNEINNNVLVTMSTGVYLDGGIDNSIVTHEYGHGISNRLTGGRINSSCLGNAEQGGEGWSDYLALMITTNWQDAQLTDGSKPRSIGAYANGQDGLGKGIRRVPYTTNMMLDTLTYRSMDGNTTGNGEEHNIGEIWCSALWDMTWNIIQHEGSITPDLYNSSGTGGNIIAFRLIMEGMKLQPCQPGFLDARNAILAADSILYNGRHKCDVWNAFARRGMGYSAVQGLSTRTDDQVPAFDVPSGIAVSKSVIPAIVNTGTEISYTTTIACQCQVPATTYSMADTIPSGFTYVSSSTGSLQGNVIQFAPIAFSNPLDVITLSITLKASGAGCPVTRPVNDDRETNFSGGFTAEQTSGSINWVSSQNHSRSAPNAWLAANSGNSSHFTLTSGSFVPGNLSVLSFWHYFVTENYIDGGKVEISVNDGTSWIDAMPYFLKNGYNGLLNSSAPQPNTFAFTGNSYATSSSNNGQFIESLVDLTPFANQPVKIRFRMQTNSGNAAGQTYDGWHIDDIVVTNGCGGISRTALLTDSNNKVDSISRPMFIMANSLLPLVFTNFLVKQAGNEILLSWETNSELNTMNFEIERSQDGIHWSKIGTVPANELVKNSYFFKDEHPFDYLNFYRLKVNDRDGRYIYTIIKKIEINNLNILSIVPNPASNKTTIFFGINAKATVLSITDLEGRILQKHTLNESDNSHNLSTRNFPPGTYLIRVESKRGLTIKKLLVIH